MTRVKIKTDMFRREFSATNVAESSEVWILECAGFVPVRYEANNLHDAVDKALVLVPTLQIDRNYVSKRKGMRPPWLAPKGGDSALTATQQNQPSGPRQQKHSAEKSSRDTSAPAPKV